MSERDIETKEQFIEQVRDEGLILEGQKYFATGEGRSTQYKREDEDGSVEDITKADVAAAWDEAQQEVAEEPTTGETEVDVESDGEPDTVHLGTLYYSRKNWTDEHLAAFEDVLQQLGWDITGEVDSGGYRLGAPER